MNSDRDNYFRLSEFSVKARIIISYGGWFWRFEQDLVSAIRNDRRPLILFETVIPTGNRFGFASPPKTLGSVPFSPECGPATMFLSFAIASQLSWTFWVTTLGISPNLDKRFRISKVSSIFNTLSVSNFWDDVINVLSSLSIWLFAESCSSLKLPNRIERFPHVPHRAIFLSVVTL